MRLHPALRTFPSKRQNENGFFTIWLLGLCVCLLFLGGLSLDLWRGFTDRRQLASMADAAAVAGASQLDLDAFKQSPSVVQLNSASAQTVATAYMQQQAADKGVTLTSLNVTVDAATDTVTVDAETKLNLTLTKIFAPLEDFTVQVHGAAQPRVAP